MKRKMKEENWPLSEEVLKSIARAEKEFQKGRFLTTDQLRKKLGI